MATLPGAWRYRVSAWTGWRSVSILRLGEAESLICNLYLNVAALKLVWVDKSLTYTSMLLGHKATNKQQPRRSAHSVSREVSHLAVRKTQGTTSTRNGFANWVAEIASRDHPPADGSAFATHHTLPAWRVLAKVKALLMSLVITPAAKPYMVWLALSVTSLMSLNLIMVWTGPNICDVKKKIDSHGRFNLSLSLSFQILVYFISHMHSLNIECNPTAVNWCLEQYIVKLPPTPHPPFPLYLSLPLSQKKRSPKYVWPDSLFPSPVQTDTHITEITRQDVHWPLLSHYPTM